MFDLEGKWHNKAEQTDSALGPSKIGTVDTPPVHDIIHRQIASFSPLDSFPVPATRVFSSSSSASPIVGVETPPAGPANFRQIQNIHCN